VENISNVAYINQHAAAGMLDAALVCWVERYKALCDILSFCILLIDHSMCLSTDRQEMEPTDAEE